MQAAIYEGDFENTTYFNHWTITVFKVILCINWLL